MRKLCCAVPFPALLLAGVQVAIKQPSDSSLLPLFERAMPSQRLLVGRCTARTLCCASHSPQDRCFTLCHTAFKAGAFTRGSWCMQGSPVRAPAGADQANSRVLKLAPAFSSGIYMMQILGWTFCLVLPSLSLWLCSCPHAPFPLSPPSDHHRGHHGCRLHRLPVTCWHPPHWLGSW